MSSLTKAALICGSGSMIILVSILINLPFVVQIFLLLTGLVISIYGVFLLAKMVVHPPEKLAKDSIEQPTGPAPKKKKGPTSTR
ncbi:hypothetical protein [Lysinibacillus parviboronicapiens]|uniref:hypothetical protein n=1 Tax=Lysinibacillus parviboronicapiens TaxID=436516 RepID=UPI000D3AF34B|nr:hypothetical protein [Lysinibacillus parviboronicapiens]